LDFHDSTAAAVAVSLCASRPGIGRRAARPAVINEAFARKFFHDEGPIGKHFGTEADNSRQYEVVGIAKDARYLTIDKPDDAFSFLPEAQADYSQTNLGSLFLHDIVILIRKGLAYLMPRCAKPWLLFGLCYAAHSCSSRLG